MRMHQKANDHCYYHCRVCIHSFQKVTSFLVLLLLLLLVPTTRVVQALALSTTSTSTSTSTTSSSTSTSHLDWQDELLQSSLPLVPTPLSRALETLQHDGVVRLENIRVDPESCQILRERILQEITLQQQKQQQKQQSQQQQSSSSSSQEEEECKHYVPGTRLRFRNAMDIAFGGDARHDLLLPLDTWPELTSVLVSQSSAIGQLEPLLQRAAYTLLPRLHGSTSSSSSSSSSSLSCSSSYNNNNTKQEDPVELVELASLVVRPGSTHQPFHGDYRRFVVEDQEAIQNNNNSNHNNNNNSNNKNNNIKNNNINSNNNSNNINNNNNSNSDEEPKEHTLQREGKLPPRLVTFVALQSIPTKEHGVTAFVTGTHTGPAHELVYGKNNHNSNGNSGNNNNGEKMDSQKKLLLETMSTNGVRTTEGFVQGEVLIYDASVLHWGSTNSVPQNNRVMLYFGVSRAGDAALLSSSPEVDAMMVQGGFEQVPPVTLQQVLYSHGSLDNDKK